MQRSKGKRHQIKTCTDEAKFTYFKAQEQKLFFQLKNKRMKNHTRRVGPEICRDMESNPIDPVRLQRCLMDSQKDHPVIQPAHYRESDGESFFLPLQAGITRSQQRTGHSPAQSSTWM